MFQLQCIQTYSKRLQETKVKKEIRKCYKCDKVGHFVKNCRLGQKIKNRSIQDDLDNEDKEDNNKKEDLVRSLEQAQYNEPLYIVNP